MHPVDLLYQQATYIVSPDMAEPETIDAGICHDCLRPAEEWLEPNRGYRGKSSYYVPFQHCISCESLYTGSVRALGVERLTATRVAVGGKFGMLASAALIVDQQGATLVASNKILEKLPASFPHKTVPLTGKAVLNFFMKYKASWPALFISDLGRKKTELIQNLHLSYSKDTVWVCNADDSREVNFRLLSVINTEVKKWNVSRKNLFIKNVRALALGFQTPMELSQYFQNHHEERSLIQSMPQDPHARLQLVSLL